MCTSIHHASISLQISEHAYLFVEYLASVHLQYNDFDDHGDIKLLGFSILVFILYKLSKFLSLIYLLMTKIRKDG